MGHSVDHRCVCKELTTGRGFLAEMLAERAECFIKTSLASLDVDATGVTTMVTRLKRAAAKYVAYKFWVPVLRRSDSSVVILIVSIDG